MKKSIIAVVLCLPLTAPPFGASANADAKQADVWFENYRFRDGETISRLRLHYATLGTPTRGADGQVTNAVMVLHWTGADGNVLQSPAFMQALFGSGRPLLQQAERRAQNHVPEVRLP